MTLNLAVSLLRQGNNGDQLLQILDSIANDVTEANINDCAAYYAAISAQPSLQEVQF